MNFTLDSDRSFNTFELLTNLTLGMLLSDVNITELSNMSMDNFTEHIELLTRATDNGTHMSRRDSLAVVVPVTICYAIIFIAGVLGNVITCIVISRNKSMHTATNYYLFNLAISDLLLLLSGK